MVNVTNLIGTKINIAAPTGMISNDALPCPALPCPALPCPNAIDTITVSDRTDVIEVPDGFRHSESRKRL